MIFKDVSEITNPVRDGFTILYAIIERKSTKDPSLEESERPLPHPTSSISSAWAITERRSGPSRKTGKLLGTVGKRDCSPTSMRKRWRWPRVHSPRRCRILRGNGKSLRWMGLTRERWCCTRGLVSRLDMNTCQTSIKTDILI